MVLGKCPRWVGAWGVGIGLNVYIMSAIDDNILMTAMANKFNIKWAVPM